LRGQADNNSRGIYLCWREDRTKIHVETCG